VVNGNIYTAKCDVALNGGPSGQQSHHLPDGVYDVAVTAPSGNITDPDSPSVLGKGYGVVVINNGEGLLVNLSMRFVSPSPYDTTPIREVSIRCGCVPLASCLSTATAKRTTSR